MSLGGQNCSLLETTGLDLGMLGVSKKRKKAKLRPRERREAKCEKARSTLRGKSVR